MPTRIRSGSVVLATLLMVGGFCVILLAPRWLRTAAEAAEPSLPIPDAPIGSQLPTQATGEVPVDRVATATGKPGVSQLVGDAQGSAAATAAGPEDWAGIGKNQRSLLELLVRASPIEHQDLLRNGLLNPRDVELASATRTWLRDYCRRVSPEIASLAAMTNTAAASDLLVRVTRGEASSQGGKDYQQRLTPDLREAAVSLEDHLVEAIAKRRQVSPEEVRAAKSTVVVIPTLVFGEEMPLAWVAKGGRVYSALARELPNALRVLQARKRLYLEVAQVVCGVFVTEGALGAEAANVLLLEFMDALEREFPGD